MFKKFLNMRTNFQIFYLFLNMRTNFQKQIKNLKICSHVQKLFGLSKFVRIFLKLFRFFLNHMFQENVLKLFDLPMHICFRVQWCLKVRNGHHVQWHATTFTIEWSSVRSHARPRLLFCDVFTLHCCFFGDVFTVHCRATVIAPASPANWLAQSGAVPCAARGNRTQRASTRSFLWELYLALSETEGSLASSATVSNGSTLQGLRAREEKM